MKVLEGGNIPTLVTRNVHELRAMEKEIESKEVVETREEVSDAKTYHRILSCPLVKKEERGERSRYEKPSLDISLPHVSFLFNFLDFEILSFYFHFYIFVTF